MRRTDLPPVPQLSLTRKKSQQVPTNQRGQKSQSIQSSKYNSQSQCSLSRLTINSMSRVQSPEQSRITTTSISRDAYMMQPIMNSLPHSNSASGLTQQPYGYSGFPQYQQNYYVPRLLNSIQNDRLQIELQLKTQLLIKDIDMKQVLYNQKMRKLLREAQQMDRQLESKVYQQSINEKSILELNDIANESMELGKSCVFQMQKLLNAF